MKNRFQQTGQGLWHTKKRSSCAGGRQKLEGYLENEGTGPEWNEKGGTEQNDRQA